MTLRLHRGCNSRNLLGIQLITLLWRVVGVGSAVTAAVVAQAEWWQLQLLCHQVRHTQSLLALVVLEYQVEREIMVQILLFLRL
jgi:hypothetical protein